MKVGDQVKVRVKCVPGGLLNGTVVVFRDHGGVYGSTIKVRLTPESHERFKRYSPLGHRAKALPRELWFPMGRLFPQA